MKHFSDWVASAVNIGIQVDCGQISTTFSRGWLAGIIAEVEIYPERQGVLFSQRQLPRQRLMTGCLLLQTNHGFRSPGWRQ